MASFIFSAAGTAERRFDLAAAVCALLREAEVRGHRERDKDGEDEHDDRELDEREAGLVAQAAHPAPIGASGVRLDPERVTLHPLGEVSERSKEHDWKSCGCRKVPRGFESLSLRP